MEKGEIRLFQNYTYQAWRYRTCCMRRPFHDNQGRPRQCCHKIASQKFRDFNSDLLSLTQFKSLPFCTINTGAAQNSRKSVKNLPYSLERLADAIKHMLSHQMRLVLTRAPGKIAPMMSFSLNSYMVLSKTATCSDFLISVKIPKIFSLQIPELSFNSSLPDPLYPMSY